MVILIQSLIFCIQDKRPKTIAKAFLGISFYLLTQSTSAEEIVGRLSYHWSPKHTSAVYAEMFAAEVNKRAKGRLRIDTYPNKQLSRYTRGGGRP